MATWLIKVNDRISGVRMIDVEDVRNTSRADIHEFFKAHPVEQMIGAGTAFTKIVVAETGSRGF